MEDNQKDKKKLILAVDDDHSILDLLKMLLEQDGYEVRGVNRGYKAIKVAQEINPNLIILDWMMPEMDGMETLKRLRANIYTRGIPIVILSARNSAKDIAEGLGWGADGYFEKPFKNEELRARIKSILVRQADWVQTNPLTKLPGNEAIQNEILRRIETGEKFSFCYADLDHFKSFNDKYSFLAGDEVIVMTANTILEVVEEYGTDNDFVGHIGGDDFMYITRPENDIKISDEIIRRFDERIKKFYDKEDLERGFIEGPDRQHLRIVKNPLVSISIEIISNENRDITHPGKIRMILGELKEVVKKKPGSNYIKDSRTDDESSSEIHVKRPKVVLADKNTEKLWGIADLLKKNWIQVYAVESGSAAIEALPEIKPDMLILNKELKLISGYDVFRLVRSNEDFQKMPILFLIDDDEIIPKQLLEKEKVYTLNKNLEGTVLVENINKILVELGVEIIKVNKSNFLESS
jgi:diguanylate cyclase (GGDEF)-like protein